MILIMLKIFLNNCKYCSLNLNFKLSFDFSVTRCISSFSLQVLKRHEISDLKPGLRNTTSIRARHKLFNAKVTSGALLLNDYNKIIITLNNNPKNQKQG